MAAVRSASAAVGGRPWTDRLMQLHVRLGAWRER